MYPNLFGLLILIFVAVGNAQRRILSEYYANPGDFPYQVAVLKDKAQRYYLCGGSIITNQYILTAAHCVEDVGPNKIIVSHGSINYLNGSFAFVSKIISHEEYNSEYRGNDIALLKLATPLVFDKFTRAVPLRKSPVPAGAGVYISGFGSKRYDGKESELLKYDEMSAVANEECGSSTEVYEGILCLNGPILTGACSGDSGGPAVYEGELVGVANFVDAKKCGSENPDGYAEVSYFYDWIMAHTKDQSA